MPPDTPATKPPRPAKAADAAPKPEPAERLARTTTPKPRRDVGLAWLVVLGLVVLAAAPLLIDLNQPALWSEQEALAFAISTETHTRKTPVTDAQTSLDAWTPVYEGASRWDIAPGGVWLHQVMYTGLDATGSADEAGVRQRMLLRARLGSVLMALLFVAAVFWIGHSLGGVSTGALSAAVAMTLPLVIGFGRSATPDAAALAWSTLSIAGALWAMRPLRASPALTRQLIGWLVCGAALGLAALTAGPRAVPTTLLCTVVLAMLCPRRVGHVMGLIGSTAIAALFVTPWALHVHDHDPNVWQMWVNELTPDVAEVGVVQVLHRAGWRLSMSATLAGLWLVWLIPAVAQPFSTSTGKARRKLMLGWAWLVTSAVLVALAPGPTRLATLLVTVAPASVSIGLVMQQFHDLSAEGRHARLWLVCRWIAAGSMLVLAVGLPTLAYLLSYRPDLLHALPELKRPLLLPMELAYYIGAAVALLLASGLFVRFAVGHHAGRTVACLALWLLTVFTLGIIPIARGPLLNSPAELPDPAPPSASL
ncbi:MAG: ArnT family glycosyltransferase [Phycisphaeraceae bacterium]